MFVSYYPFVIVCVPDMHVIPPCYILRVYVCYVVFDSHLPCVMCAICYIICYSYVSYVLLCVLCCIL